LNRSAIVKYCCEYAYWCPAALEVHCYVHGGVGACCRHEDLHECLPDMYGSEDELMFGDGFMCLRCGDHEAVGNPHHPPAPGYPKKSGPPRTSWLDLPEDG
jgi:hypothetical protein